MIWNPAMETMPRSDLERLQLERLRQVAGRVYERVPFYRRRFDEAGIRPDEIRSLADVARLPFTRKGDFREQYPYGLFASPLSDDCRGARAANCAACEMSGNSTSARPPGPGAVH